MTSKSYETRLRELAIQLVTPERFSPIADLALDDTVEFTMPPELTLFDDLDTIHD